MTDAEKLAALLASPGVRRIFAALDRDGEECVSSAAPCACPARRDHRRHRPGLDRPAERKRAARGKSRAQEALTGLDHGTITVVIDGAPFEATTLREDVEADGRRAKVRFGRSFDADGSAAIFPSTRCRSTGPGGCTPRGRPRRLFRAACVSSAIPAAASPRFPAHPPVLPFFRPLRRRARRTRIFRLRRSARRHRNAVARKTGRGNAQIAGRAARDFRRRADGQPACPPISASPRGRRA